MGPLKGYHHETYVFPLPGRTVTVKCREPRDAILWFDRRCFLSEEELLRALKGHITRIPDIVDVEDMGLQSFIEGDTLGALHRPGRRVPDAVFDQIVGLFRELALIRPDMLDVERRCEPEDRPEDGDSSGFLDRLIVFIEDQVYGRNRAEFEGLFRDLGVTDDSFQQLRKRTSGLHERPFCLLHADLHRENFIIDPCGRLWTIDWELAMFGDPLYDVATHLYLMRFPAEQERRMAREWCRVVEGVRPGSAYGWERDLPLLLEFKRAQSVPTDLIRIALSLCDGPDFDWLALPRAAGKLHRVLAAGAEPLGLTDVPGRAQIMAALVHWHRGRVGA
ncbi:phosphotransferase [Streptomyces bullii]